MLSKLNIIRAADGDMSPKLTRLQCPVRLAFGTTIEKGQSESLLEYVLGPLRQAFVLFSTFLDLTPVSATHEVHTSINSLLEISISRSKTPV
jgi:hypothetical protein